MFIQSRTMKFSAIKSIGCKIDGILRSNMATMEEGIREKFSGLRILKVVFFMDKPGLLEFFKQRHQQFYVEKKPMSLEELNRVAEKYGTHFKTLN